MRHIILICPHCDQEIRFEIDVKKRERRKAPRDVQRTRELDSSLVEKIRQGLPVTSGGSKEITNALTRLRRNGIIYNQGTRKNPKWVLVETLKNPEWVLVESEWVLVESESTELPRA